jgi:hypothetical protein
MTFPAWVAGKPKDAVCPARRANFWGQVGGRMSRFVAIAIEGSMVTDTTINTRKENNSNPRLINTFNGLSFLTITSILRADALYHENHGSTRTNTYIVLLYFYAIYYGIDIVFIIDGSERFPFASIAETRYT